MANVNDFMSKLSSQTTPIERKNPSSNGFNSRRLVEKISLNFGGNLGRYQILPFDSTIIDYPFVDLRGTREICIPRKQTAQDGTETIYNAWIKLLPKSAYKMKDMNGRIVDSLTAEEDQLLGEAYNLFDQLFTETDARNTPAIMQTLCRKRNYTIFHAYCLNRWTDDQRKADRSNFCGLFVTTASGFLTSVSDDIHTRAVINGNSDFIGEIYNRQLTGRKGFMIFTISHSTQSKGYSVSVTHETNLPRPVDAVVTDEEAEMMVDPVASFLGWQAKKSDNNVPAEQRQLFNAPLIREAIAYMTSQLAAVRLAKESGTSIEEAIKATNETALANMKPAEVTGPTTNDPMLAAVNAQTAPVNGMGMTQVEAERVVNTNTNPFSSPAAAHIDPLTNAPVNTAPQGQSWGGNTAAQQPSAAPFTQPSFATSGNQMSNGGFPF